MSKWRLVVLALLLLAPVLALLGFGSWFLWERKWWFYAWWPMAGSLSLAYFLAWRWQRKRRLLNIDYDVLPHWTERDRQAWQLVEARARAGDQLPTDNFSDLNFYLQVAQEMALELAQFYRPGAIDPYGSLTIPEILAVSELASHELSRKVQKYVPGSHLLSINDWKRARQMTDWYRKASNVYWIGAALLDPVGTGIRFAATQFGMTQPWQKFQDNLLLWFYTAFVHQLGTYLIELHSGRLRVGAGRYRELLAKHRPGLPEVPAEVAPDEVGPEPASQVTITIMGQVKAGKSSLVNALLGERQAITDVLPATSDVTRYSVQPEGIASKLVLLDTVGYGHTGPKEDQLRATQEAAKQSDLLLLVLHARNPARQADDEGLKRLHEWFQRQPHLKMPAVLAVVTHIDLLSPALEWAPPYDWVQAKRPKEQSIQRALAAVLEQFSGFIVGAVPVCVAEGKVFGIDEAVLPAIAQQLDEAHGVALLRVLKAEADTARLRKVWHQVLEAGKHAAGIFLQGLKK